ncbi:MAG: carboxypeptidase regulatory-like domain-containing protein, partial [Bryobacteraceae bacterium]|nr:carboxypeptidase regulatory-like domain-containing protein [Bryobacteraceae bacterium]
MKKWIQGCWVSFLMGLLALSSVTLHGQTAATATVVGTVTDPSGGVVAGASVTLLEPSTGVTRSTLTNDSGQYTFVTVPPGTYRLTVSAPGFRQAAVEQVKLDVAKAYTVDVQLEVGALTETVEVRAEARSELQTLDSTVGAVIQGESLLRLPTINRSAGALLTLQPLVTPSRGMSDPNFTGQVAGMRSDQNTFNLDGVDATDVTSGTSGYFASAIDWAGATPSIPVPLESVEEFRVSTTNSNATFGRSSGGQVNLVTKRGTNQIHGSLYWYHQNDNLNANRWESNRLGIRKPELKDNRFGTSLGGPLIRNRLFVFGNYEGRRFPRANLVSRLVPSEELKRGILRFRDATGTVREYNVRQFDPRGVGLSPVISALWAKLPAGNDPGRGDGLNTLGFTAPGDNSIRMDFGVARMDYHLGSSWRLTSTYRYATQLETALGQVDIANLTGCGKPVCPGGSTPVEPRFFSTTLAGALTPRLTSETNLGYRRGWWAYRRINPFPQVSGTAAALMVAQGTLDSGIDVDTQRARSRIWRDQTYSLNQNMSWMAGKHLVQFGGQVALFRVFHERDDKVIGSLTTPVYELNASNFVSISAAARPPTCGGSITSNCLQPGDVQRWNDLFAAGLGMVDKGGLIVTRDGDLNNQPFGTPMRIFGRFQNYEGYINDVWRIRPSLTLTLGLTYSIQTPVTDDNGLQTILINAENNQEIVARELLEARRRAGDQGQTLNPSIGYVPIRQYARRKKIYDVDSNNFAPRIAAAWNPQFTSGFLGRLFGDRKSVLRGGYAITYDRVNGVGVVMLPILGVGFSQTATCNAPTAGGGCSSGTNETTAFRIGVDGDRVPIPTLGKPAVPIVPGVGGEALSFSIDPKMRIGKSQSINFTIQRELPGNMILEMGYVGRWSNELPQNFQLNSMYLHFRDQASGQTFAQAFDGVARQLRGGTAAAQVTPQPFFENQLRGLAQCNPNCTAWLASSQTVRFVQGQVNNLINAINAVRPGGAFYSRQVQDLFVRGSGGRANYNAGFLSLTKRSSSLSYTLNYTISKTLDQYGLNQENIGVSSTPYDLNVDYGPAIFDRTHVFNAQWFYQLPFGRGRRWSMEGVADKLLGGWYLGGIYTANSGLPILAGTHTQVFGGAQLFGGLAAGAVPITPQKYANSAVTNLQVSGSVGSAGNVTATQRGTQVNLFADPAA